MRILGLILKISKYLLILTFIILIAIVVIFFKYSKRLDYKMPEKHTITILDKDNDYFFEINNANKQTYININNIDQDIINAFISIEDKDFYTHKGINIKRIGGAIISNIKSNSFSQGASTITQQLARNLFLSNEKTYKRKIEEISIAISLETRYSKDEILEGYLNTIYFGHGVYGIQDACQYFFKKDASNVTLAEACVIAAIPKGPALYSPVNNYENKRGFILTNRASMNEKPFKKFLDVINPYSKLEVLSIADLDAIYGNINSKDKLLNFANFVDKNGGCKQPTSGEWYPPKSCQ